MIVTLTPNPAIDRTLAIASLVRGEVHRAAAPVVEPSGKGVNVAKALLVNGHAAKAVLPADGQLAALLAAAGVPCEVARIAGAVRTNVSLLEPDGTVTKVNEPGPELSDEDRRRLLEMALAAEGELIAASGSLPPGMPSDFYAELVERSARPVAVDTSGAALKAVAGAGPWLVKPNLDELSELVGQRPQTLAEVVEAADAVRCAGARAVLVSLGGDGAVLVDERGATHGEVVVDRPRNTVGAGDALLAGFLADGLEEALAYAAAAVGHMGTHTPAVTAKDRAAVRIHDAIDGHRRLS
ncbi:1-phosphofructokinase family hexose kinase [Kutzneria kofuensis]|uniref:1-phosphofructokinase family hexose kinase n=1 Tax=Kutzneria kofuensis TaxID=103725 RepID=A0A7W9KEL3_9PSEU|nr:hexose kinase [Kutzneria kofuensis]MBB5890434.1 1-phosphofructokinase family hexose kinase [Kutzneria kofuensis]